MGNALFAAAGTNVAPKTVELIADAGFRNGFRVNESGEEKRVVKWNNSGTPAWDILHHHSKSSFANTNNFSFRKDGLTFKDDCGTLVVHPDGREADFILGMNAFKEFDGVYRPVGDPWPHVYFSQRVSNLHGHSAQNIPLSAMDKIDFSISVKLLYDNRNEKEGYNRHIHAAQFVFFFTIQNVNRQSLGYGDYYWFGILLYDSRKPVTSLHAMQDKGWPKKKGTDKLIYDIGVKPFTSEVVADGKWVAVKGDLLPHIIAGLQESWKRGFLQGSKNVADYQIGGVVMGYEITGLNDIAVAVRDLRATAMIR